LNADQVGFRQEGVPRIEIWKAGEGGPWHHFGEIVRTNFLDPKAIDARKSVSKHVRAFFRASSRIFQGVSGRSVGMPFFLWCGLMSRFVSRAGSSLVVRPVAR